jgi:acyl-coenzyme A synthetase/AMP-(fatty) acid ligase
VVITASAVNRGTKRVDLKAIVDDAANKAAANGYRDLQKVLVFEKSALPR